MRLTHLKLAGFKSFVDPTTLHIHGQRVGVVGPNGCGKSNVMESIRWVLGESSAKEMRGDSMQDVIFNGSANRKPVSRASVELLFDNSLGGASGEWSQYAEISVKRVLHRDGGSDYLINNTKVRRRDVADLFLGTGLGGRAYAIIGQNTISRIVEAKPEELRVFLEEAAGISKYKERRRETELRLRDTRENLTRVEDIRRELEKQITRLEAQALVAQQYHQLKEALELAEGQFWWLKRRDAALAWEKSQRQVERLANDLEAQTASLRHHEAGLEQLRQAYHESSQQVQDAQARYYESNAKVSALEQELRFARETRDRLVERIAQLSAEQERAQLQAAALEAELQQQSTRRHEAAEGRVKMEAREVHARAQLPLAEQAHRDAQAVFGHAQSAIHQSEQQLQLERTHHEHARKLLGELQQRLQRLSEEEQRLVLPDAGELQRKEFEAETLQNQLLALESEIAKSQNDEVLLSNENKHLQEDIQVDSRLIHQQEAQLSALQKLQQQVGHTGQLDGWLKHHRLEHLPRLWQLIQPAPGYERAMEAWLGYRLNALLLETVSDIDERPPAPLVMANRGGHFDMPAAHPAGWQPLAGCIGASDEKLEGVIADWLARVWVLPAGEDITQAKARLNPGEALVSMDGDIATRYSLALFAPQGELSGVLERQREIDALATTLPGLKAVHQQKVAALEAAEQQLQQCRRALHAHQQQQKSLTASLHALRMDVQRLQQRQQHAAERRQHISDEKSEVYTRKLEVETQLSIRGETVQALLDGQAGLRLQRDHASQARQQAEQALRSAREELMASEREVQQAQFSEQMISNQIKGLEERLHALHETRQSLASQHDELAAQVGMSTDDELQSRLAQALAEQHVAETALAAARSTMAEAESRLQEQERVRLQAEQQLHPMRDRLEQSRLQEQQARLHFEHCSDQLSSTGLEEADLEPTLPKGGRAVDLEQRGKTLQAEIDALGAVNLAAIQELASERERKVYLDSQAQDLEQAMQTLEDAILKIDRETRSRLQHTYDEANRHFNELFQTLFGGGQAQLQLLGDEILDTGIQVFAQPPGKKNSTIHLLSGGEKALTAMALVFALFRLNPAPFCLMDEVDAPLDDSNTERFCALVRKMSERTQFMFVSHNKITMEMAQQLIGVTMQESGVSRIVEVDMEAALQMQTDII